MMWKNILAASALCASLAFLITSLSTATAGMGPAVSLGSNPIHSIGGYSNSTANETVSAQPGQVFVITDVTISAQYNYDLEIVFTTSAGVEIGRYKTWNYSNYNGPAIIDSHMQSGLQAPEGENLNIQVTGRGSYTFSGYFAQP